MSAQKAMYFALTVSAIVIFNAGRVYEYVQNYEKTPDPQCEWAMKKIENLEGIKP